MYKWPEIHGFAWGYFTAISGDISAYQESVEAKGDTGQKLTMAINNLLPGMILPSPRDEIRVFHRQPF